MKNEILIIDDNEADNFLHQRMIKKAGFEGAVKVCSNSKDGLDTLLKDFNSGSAPELIFLDINMPGFSGWQIIDMLDDSNICNEIEKCAIYIMSTSSNPEDNIRARENDLIRGFLQKPLSVEKVKNVIQGSCLNL